MGFNGRCVFRVTWLNSGGNPPCLPLIPALIEKHAAISSRKYLQILPSSGPSLSIHFGTLAFEDAISAGWRSPIPG